MKAAQLLSYGGKDTVQIRQDVPEPNLTPTTLIVEVKAASVNPADWKIREGYFHAFIHDPFPFTLGGDFSGVVREVGSEVRGFSKGDAVFGHGGTLAGGTGSFAEVLAVGAKTIAHKPPKLTHNQAAALPLAGVSAWQAIVDHLHLSAGQKVLIHGGAGGIGSLAIQIAKSLGVFVATTAGTPDISFVQNLGADHVIDYKQHSFETLLKDFDAVFDTVGVDVYKKSFSVLRPGGTLVSMTEQPDESLMQQYHVQAINQLTHVTHERLTELARFIETKGLYIQIDKTFSLDQTADALEYLRTGHHQGKIIITV